MEVYVLVKDNYEPSCVQGVYSSVDPAKASLAKARWTHRRDDDPIDWVLLGETYFWPLKQTIYYHIEKHTLEG